MSHVRRITALTVLLTLAAVLLPAGAARAEYDLTVSSAPSSNVSSTGSGPVTFRPIGPNANLNVDTLENYTSSFDVTLSTRGTGGAQPGDIAIISRFSSRVGSGDLITDAARNVRIDADLYVSGPGQGLRVGAGGKAIIGGTGTRSIYAVLTQTWAPAGGVLLAADTLLQSLRGSVTLNATVDGDARLSLDADSAFVNRDIGASTPLVSMFGSGFTSVWVSASIHTVATIGIYDLELAGSGSTTLRTDLGAVGCVRIDGTRNLTLSAGGGALVYAGIGASTPPPSLDATGTPTLEVGSYGVTTTGGQSYARVRPWTYLSQGTSPLTLSSTAGAVTAARIDGGALPPGPLVADGVTVTAPSAALGDVGQSSPPDSFTVTGPLQLRGDVTTDGTQTYGGAVTLAEATATLTGTQVAFSAAVDDRARDENRLVISTMSGTSFGGRVGATNAPRDVTVTGPAVLAGGAITAVRTVTFGGPITLAADALLTAGGALTLSGPVDGAHALDVQAAGVSEFSAPIGATTPLQRLTVGGGGMTRLSGAARSVTTIGDQSYSDALDVLADTTFTSSGGSLTSSGGLDLNTRAGVVNAAGTISGAISGSGSLRKAGAGTLRLSAGNPFAGTLVQAGGKLEVTGATPSASVSLTGGTLAGSGPVGTVTGSGGTLAPGLTSGVLSTAGLALGSSDTVALGLDGPVAGSGHDQLRVTGLVALGGATLSVSLGFSPALDVSFTLVDNDGTDAVTGTFAGLPEGAILDLEGLHFTLSYAGGTDDNDVTLTRVLLPASVALADAPSRSSASGDSVTFTATVSGASPAPTGSVRFEVDGTLGAPAALSGGTAQFTTSSLEAGNHTVIARYGGDADHAMTASAALIHTVQAPPHPPGTTPRGAPTAPVSPVKALRVTGVLATPYCLAPPPAKVKGAGRDITFSFALSDPARVTARVQRRLTPATRARRTCLLRPDGRRGRPVSFRDVVAPSRPVGKRRPFAQAFDAKAGSVRIRLSSLTRGARLTPGWYRLLLTAVRADGSAVAPVDVQFLVLRR